MTSNEVAILTSEIQKLSSMTSEMIQRQSSQQFTEGCILAVTWVALCLAIGLFIRARSKAKSVITMLLALALVAVGFEVSASPVQVPTISIQSGVQMPAGMTHQAMVQILGPTLGEGEFVVDRITMEPAPFQLAAAGQFPSDYPKVTYEGPDGGAWCNATWLILTLVLIVGGAYVYFKLKKKVCTMMDAWTNKLETSADGFCGMTQPVKAMDEGSTQYVWIQSLCALDDAFPSTEFWMELSRQTIRAVQRVYDTNLHDWTNSVFCEIPNKSGGMASGLFFTNFAIEWQPGKPHIMPPTFFRGAL